MKLLALCVVVFVSITGCALLPWRNAYLREGTGRLTSDEVAQQLGPPHNQGKLSSGSEVWSYQYRDSSINSDNMGIVHGGSSCTEYILIFDQQHILESFKRQGC